MRRSGASRSATGGSWTPSLKPLWAVVDYQYGPGYVAVVDPRLAAPAYAWRPFKVADIDDNKRLDFVAFAQKKHGTGRVTSVDPAKADSWYAEAPKGNMRLVPQEVAQFQYGVGWMAVPDPRVSPASASWRAADTARINDALGLNFRAFAQTKYGLMADIITTSLEDPHSWKIIH